MTDNKTKKTQGIGNKVAGGEPYEIDYLVRELGVSRQDVEAAIAAVGNDREKIKKYLKKKN